MIDPAGRPPRSSAWRVLWAAIAAAHLLAVAALFALFALRPAAGWAAFLLYAPRAPFALPALITFFALRGRWRVLPVVTAALVLGPLMGLQVNGPGHRGQVRLVSWHVWFGGGNPEAVRAALQEADPDVVVLQAADLKMFASLEDAFATRSWLQEDQFAIGSRWPVRLVGAGPVAPNGWRSWVRFAVESPVGTLDVFAVHPHSPRTLLRGGLRRGLGGDRSEMRALQGQLKEIDEAVRHGGALRVVAGDFNVPGRSGLLAGLFEGTADAFAEAGNGYGYTFPVHGRWIPWMRLDRVLTGPGLRATRAQVVGHRGSDHAAVLVELSVPAP